MASFIDTYPYLVGDVFGFFLFAPWLLILPDQRRPILLSGLLASPQALLSVYLIPRYWNPNRVAVFLVGPEDVLFCFMAGAMAWIEVMWVLRRVITLNIQRDLVVRRYLVGHGFGLFLGVLLYVLGLRGMNIPLSVMLVWGLVLLLLIGGFSRIAMVGAALSSVVYAVVLLCASLFWPNLFAAWTWPNLWGLTLCGIPMEEIVWGVLYGPVWAMSMAWMMDARVNKP